IMDDMRFRARMEFIAEQQAQFTIDMTELKTETAELKGIVAALVDAISRLEAQAESNRAETREAINNLIIANEVTRKLTEDVARLTIQTSHRVTRLESEVFEKGTRDA